MCSVRITPTETPTHTAKKGETKGGDGARSLMREEMIKVY